MERNGRCRQRVQVLEVGGDLYASDMVRIKNRIDRLMQMERVYMVLNLRKARYADLAGLGILVERIGQVRRLDGDLRLAGVNARIKKLFHQTGTDRLMQFYGGVRAAVRSFSAA